MLVGVPTLVPLVLENGLCEATQDLVSSPNLDPSQVKVFSHKHSAA